jgi:hypothetical protein
MATKSPTTPTGTFRRSTERRKGEHIRPFKGAAGGSVEAAELVEGDDGEVGQLRELEAGPRGRGEHLGGEFQATRQLHTVTRPQSPIEA